MPAAKTAKAAKPAASHKAEPTTTYLVVGGKHYRRGRDEDGKPLPPYKAGDTMDLTQAEAEVYAPYIALEGSPVFESAADVVARISRVDDLDTLQAIRDDEEDRTSPRKSVMKALETKERALLAPAE